MATLVERQFAARLSTANVNGGPPHLAQLLSIPVFAAGVVLAYFLSRRGRPTDGGRALSSGTSTSRSWLASRFYCFWRSASAR
ncbi:MAG TPA: hypothetical protein VMG58_00260 [Candidatus Sulfotelmatobacter sp.]|nr:hypothetical protein [Candidatus Sulfotelmatobacter sp.]